MGINVKEIENLDKEDRCKVIARYIIKYKATVREAAKYFQLSRSTIHNDVTDRFMRVDPVLYIQVQDQLNENRAMSYSRGGIATKKKYDAIKKQKEL